MLELLVIVVGSNGVACEKSVTEAVRYAQPQ